MTLHRVKSSMFIVNSAVKAVIEALLPVCRH